MVFQRECCLGATNGGGGDAASLRAGAADSDGVHDGATELGPFPARNAARHRRETTAVFCSWAVGAHSTISSPEPVETRRRSVPLSLASVPLELAGVTCRAIRAAAGGEVEGVVDRQLGSSSDCLRKGLVRSPIEQRHVELVRGADDADRAHI
eukprot:2459781-Prymnesium_polylepis.2